jgi:hypothetical protein
MELFSQAYHEAARATAATKRQQRIDPNGGVKPEFGKIDV